MCIVGDLCIDANPQRNAVSSPTHHIGLKPVRLVQPSSVNSTQSFPTPASTSITIGHTSGNRRIRNSLLAANSLATDL